MILESMVSTLNEDGSPNISPMGPVVDPKMETFVLRPFPSSRTFANLQRTREGVLHVTDDVGLFARAAIGRLDPVPELKPAIAIAGNVLVAACRGYEFEVSFIDQTGPRMNLNCRVVKTHRQRDFWGFNRGKHAVLEAAILATRLDFLPAEEITEQFTRLAVIVEKTGGSQERQAFALLRDFVECSNGKSSRA